MTQEQSPGVYTQFIEPVSPIAPVATSLAGMIGLSQFGPENQPIRIGSYGEFTRWFGDALPVDEYRDPADPDRSHAYLAHAVLGFYQNGGRGLLVERVMPPGAARATGTMHSAAPGTGPSGVALMSPARPGDAGALVSVTGTFTMAAGDTVRIGSGSTAEYRDLTAATGAGLGTTGFHTALESATANAHAAGDVITVFMPVAGAGPALSGAVAEGDTVINVTSAVDLTALPAPGVERLALSDGVHTVIAEVNGAAPGGPPGSFDLTLSDSIGTDFDASADAEVYEADTNEPLLLPAAEGTHFLAVANQIPEDRIAEIGADRSRTVLAATIPLAEALPGRVAVGANVAQVDLVASATPAATLTADLAGRALALSSRTDIAAGTVLLLTDGPVTEYAIVANLFGAALPAPDAGTVILDQAPQHGFPAGATAQIVEPTAPAGPLPDTTVIAPAETGGQSLALLNGAGWAAPMTLAVETVEGVHFVTVDGPPDPVVSATIEMAALNAEHAAGAEIALRDALMDVEALDRGRYGNDIAHWVEVEPEGLAPFAAIAGIVSPTELQLSTVAGLERGSVVEVSNPAGGAPVLRKIADVDRATARVHLVAPGLDAAALAALGPVVAPQTYSLRSREFRMSVVLRRRANPAEPSRNGEIVRREVFRNLSLDPDHSRYAPTILGAVDGPLRREDRRPRGESGLVRLRERRSGAAELAAILVSPEILTDHLPDGREIPAPRRLANGQDGMATMVDAAYIGADHAEPEQRTGLWQFVNYPDVSQLAVPGAMSRAVQNALITHCETMRFRTAILDARGPQNSVADVLAQRNEGDSVHAALYYPWLEIPDLRARPGTLDQVLEIPPSGHVMGLIARTDLEGVETPPANRVLRGITGVSRKITRTEHDALNPAGVNAILDMTEEGRGHRVYGARSMTSNAARRYLNVNRTVFFVQRSLEIGLQWAVLRVNDRVLWAAVRDSVTAFLHDFWLDGGLAGARPQDAFAVTCDETTMTPADIENGRLVCVAAIAPQRPAEFVNVELGFLTRSAREE